MTILNNETCYSKSYIHLVKAKSEMIYAKRQLTNLDPETFKDRITEIEISIKIIGDTIDKMYDWYEKVNNYDIGDRIKTYD